FPEGAGFRRWGEARERERVLRAHQAVAVQERQIQDPPLVDRFLVGLDHGAAEDREILHAVLGDQTVDRGDTLGDHVLVVVGDDLELVLLAAHVETALAVDLLEDELGRLLVRNAPRRGGAGEGRRDTELYGVGGGGTPGACGNKSRHCEKRCVNEQVLWSHGHPSWTRGWGRGPRARGL